MSGAEGGQGRAQRPRHHCRDFDFYVEWEPLEGSIRWILTASTAVWTAHRAKTEGAGDSEGAAAIEQDSSTGGMLEGGLGAGVSGEAGGSRFLRSGQGGHRPEGSLSQALQGKLRALKFPNEGS